MSQIESDKNTLIRALMRARTFDLHFNIIPDFNIQKIIKVKSWYWGQ